MIMVKRFKMAINMAAAKLLPNSNTKPAIKGPIEIVIKSIVVKTELIWAKRSSLFLDTTTIQSFSIMIFDPTEPRCAKVAKIMVIYGAKVGNQNGHDDSPTLKTDF